MEIGQILVIKYGRLFFRD